MTDIGFQFKVIYADRELIKIRVLAWNGEFGGAADVYAGIGQMEQVAEKLKGFPRDFSDTREVTLGTLDPKFAGGGVSMRFYCADRVGHACVDSTIQSCDASTGKVQCVTCSVPVEAAGVDSFVDDLTRLGSTRSGEAYLKAVVRPRQ